MFSNQILKSSLRGFCNLYQPKNYFNNNDQIVPASVYFENLKPTYKTNNKISFVFEMKNYSSKYDIIDMLYLKIIFPEQNIEKNNDFICYQDLFALKLIKKINIFLNEYTEQYDSELLYYIYNDLYNLNWDYFKNNILNSKNTGINYFSTKLTDSSLKSKTCFLPIINSFFTTKEKMKINLLNDFKVKIEIEFNSLENCYIYNNGFNLTKNFDNNAFELYLECIDINTTNDTSIKTLDFLNDSLTKSYYFLSKKYFIQKNNFDINNTIENVLKKNQLNFEKLNIIHKFNLFTKKNLFYGYNHFSSTINFLNSFLEINKQLNNTHVYLNLKSGDLINNTLQNNFFVEKLDLKSYILKITYNNVLYTCQIFSNTEWFNLTTSIYLNLTEFVFKAFDINSLSICLFNFKKIKFMFYNENDNNNKKIIEHSITDNDGRYKLFGGLFYDSNFNQSVFGFVDYELNKNTISENLFNLIISMPINENLNNKLFISNNYVYFINTFNNSFNIENNFKINIQDFVINKTKINEEYLYLYKFKNYKNDFFINDNNNIFNLIFDVNAYNTGGILNIKNEELNIEIVLHSENDNFFFDLKNISLLNIISKKNNFVETCFFMTYTIINTIYNNKIEITNDNHLIGIKQSFDENYKLPIKKKQKIEKFIFNKKI